MDFGGFILEILLIVLSVSCVVATIRMVAQKSRFAKSGVAVSVFLIATAILGAVLLRQAYSLDEPMAAAAWAGDEQKVVRLLKSGANPNGNFDGRTAIELAKDAGNTRIVVILRKAGAKE